MNGTDSTGDGLSGCAACGQSTGEGRCTNHWCHRSDREWSVIYSAGVYQGSLRRAIVEYKYRHDLSREAGLAHLLVSLLDREHTWFEEYDLLTGMPAYLGPRARRTWDPVGRLVGAMGPVLGSTWQICPSLVIKAGETEAMSGRTQWDRSRIAEGQLRRVLHPGAVDVAGARILVVDDVFTEGSTLREVARVLRRQGADEVAGLVVARPPRATGRPPGRH